MSAPGQHPDATPRLTVREEAINCGAARDDARLRFCPACRRRGAATLAAVSGGGAA